MVSNWVKETKENPKKTVRWSQTGLPISWKIRWEFFRSSLIKDEKISKNDEMHQLKIPLKKTERIVKRIRVSQEIKEIKIS